MPPDGCFGVQIAQNPISAGAPLTELTRADQFAQVGKKIVETLSGLLLYALMKRITFVRNICFTDAVFLESFYDLVDVVSVVVVFVDLEGTKDTVFRRSEK